MEEIGINESFLEYIFNVKCRYAILWGGAGSGKSHSAAQKHVIRAADGREKHKILLVRKVKNTLKHSVFAITKSLILDYGIKCHVNNTEMSFYFENGNQIITTGMDDAEKLKSIHGVTSIWIEEATELEQEDLTQLDLRLRGHTDSYKQITLTFNPISSDHWIHKYFFEKKRDKNVWDMNSNFNDNAYLDEEYKKIVMERYRHDPNLRRIYVEGKWGKERTGSEFYSSFNRDRHVGKVPYLKDEVVHVSWDFNINPYLPLSMWQVIKQNERWQARCFKTLALENPQNNTEEACREFARLFPYNDYKKGIYVYGDATGKVRSTQSHEHNYDIIERELKPYMRNWTWRVPKRNPKQSMRREFMQQVMGANRYPIDLIIDEGCELMIADLENVLEDSAGGKHKPMGKNKAGVVYEKYGHFSDTMDYFFIEAFSGYWDDYFKT